MPKLSELTKMERTEACRSIARAAHDVLSKKVDADGVPEGGTFDARMYKRCSELGIIEENEFYGNSFSKERIEVLKGFQETYDQALELARVYDDALADMACLTGDFAMPSHTLVRMWCVSRFVGALLAVDGPFSDLRVAPAVVDEDGVDDENDENDGSDEERDSDDEDNDSIVASTSDEEEEDEDEEAVEEDDEEEECDDIEEVQPGDAEEPEGPRRCKKPRIGEEEKPASDTSDDDD
jgi:hypothetical protein